MSYLYGIGFIASVILALVMTPAVKAFAVWVGAVDQPNHRKVHTRLMPRLGGLAIFAAFVGSYFIIYPVMSTLSADMYHTKAALGLLIGGAIIVLTGALDDKFDLSPKLKLLGQVIAACVVVYFGLKVELVNIPFGDTNIPIGWLSIPLTIVWIVGVTNAVNLIDGLDGLAAGVSGIATTTILVMAIIMGNTPVILLSTIMLGSIIGFLFFNFHPAKIFMGDSGALFLGFGLATLSIMGFKQVTLFSFIVPLLILGVPLSDTFFAIVRRKLNKTPISVADKNHLHHCLHLQLGLSHRNAVLAIYGIAIVFGAFAVVLSVLSQWALWLAIVVLAVLLLIIQLGAEMIGIVSKSRKPIINMFLKLFPKTAAHSDPRD